MAPADARHPTRPTLRTSCLEALRPRRLRRVTPHRQTVRAHIAPASCRHDICGAHCLIISIIKPSPCRPQPPGFLPPRTSGAGLHSPLQNRRFCKPPLRPTPNRHPKPAVSGARPSQLCAALVAFQFFEAFSRCIPTRRPHRYAFGSAPGAPLIPRLLLHCPFLSSRHSANVNPLQPRLPKEIDNPNVEG